MVTLSARSTRFPPVLAGAETRAEMERPVNFGLDGVDSAYGFDHIQEVISVKTCFMPFATIPQRQDARTLYNGDIVT